MTRDTEASQQQELSEEAKRMMDNFLASVFERWKKDVELRLHYLNMKRQKQEFSYELTQRLSFYVIGIEVVFCGYVLLNASTLAHIQYVRWIFLASGLAALFGLIWRMLYNESSHLLAHWEEENKEIQAKQQKRLARLSYPQNITYWVYILLTAVFLIGTLIGGFQYLIETTTKTKPSVHAGSGVLKKYLEITPFLESLTRPEGVIRRNVHT